MAGEEQVTMSTAQAPWPLADAPVTDITPPKGYPSSLVPDQWRWLYGLNPMAGVVDGFRWALTGKGQPPSLMLAASSAAVVFMLVGGMFFFRKMEATIADVV
jgi:lipopolysaccharide transport system permease protein